METRRFGRTGLDVSRLTFGCGAVGGLMTKGEAADQDRAVAWARDHGINHFDTAPLYGQGASETNLGRALGKDRENIIVSTKVRLAAGDLGNAEAVIRSSIETSLRRLQQEWVDLFQLHNMLSASAGGDAVTVSDVLDHILPVFDKLRAEGKTRFLGFTAHGDAEALHELVQSDGFDSAQVFYNMLTPSAGEAIADGYPAQDYKQLLTAAHEKGVGTIGVRVLAGGALSGQESRHPLGAPVVGPIGSGQDYRSDVLRAVRFEPVVAAGHAESLPELAVRYVISNGTLPTTEIGVATLEEVKLAADAVKKGPLSPAALAQIDEIRAGFVGEPR